MATKILSSQWGNLNQNLIASIWVVDRTGKQVADKNGDVTIVQCPLSESSLEFGLAWHNPFEQSGATILPTLQQMMQAGALDALFEKVDNATGTSLANYAKQISGRSSITKLNSTQVFTGMQPVKFQLTAVFRAWKDPVTEVHDPFNQLMKWALPIKLAADGSFFSRLVDNGAKQVAVLPSQSPVMVAIHYKDSTYSPMVIESITKATDSPIDANGHFTELRVPMSISSLTALDRDDWSNFTGGGK